MHPTLVVVHLLHLLVADWAISSVALAWRQSLLLVLDIQLLSRQASCVSINCDVHFTLHLLQIWLEAAHAKGMEVTGTFARRNGQIFMDMTFANRAMQPLADFAIQLNKNSSVVFEVYASLRLHDHWQF